ncbi:relaxase/mobilization nuclease domain-containing protein [Segatella albensis]|uniref:relaxase/mobilization nuclease domain-containing protein n=1 Tax=Segatella albensis TaxID=77768 RepID=UPI0003FB2736|nr:relaxase/mobilization nuclease domain-containing protein [Segatella albensis]
MIGKLKKGASFGGCVRYVTGKDEAKILASDGVLLGTNAEITQSFELQRQLNPRIKKPVGHIALSFKPEDKPRLTDEFMAKIALEYMQKFKNELAKQGVHLELVYKDKERTKVQGIRFCKDGYSFKGTQISREYSFVRLDARLGTEYNRVSPRAESMQRGQLSCHQVEQTQPTAEHTQDPWSSISSIGLFAPSNAQTYEPFPEDESAKKKKRKRRKGFSL